MSDPIVISALIAAGAALLLGLGRGAQFIIQTVLDAYKSQAKATVEAKDRDLAAKDRDLDSKDREIERLQGDVISMLSDIRTELQSFRQEMQR